MIIIDLEGKDSPPTFENIAHTNVILQLIGAQQNTYRARNGNGICSTISARNLKSSVLHMKYKSSTVLRERNISCWMREMLERKNWTIEKLIRVFVAIEFTDE